MSMLLRVLVVLGLLTMSLNTAWAEEEEAAAPVAQYVELTPPFVANFGISKKKLKYVKAEFSLRVASPEAVVWIEDNLPMIRHEIVMLLSAQTAESMKQANSQEVLREAALEAVEAVLKKEKGAPRVDDLLITTFIVQG